MRHEPTQDRNVALRMVDRTRGGLPSGKLGAEMWVFLFVILIVAGVMMEQGLVLVFGLMGSLVTGFSWVWNRVSLRMVIYERKLQRSRAFIGEEIELTVTLTNRKPVPLGWVRAEDRLPPEIEVVDAENVYATEGSQQSLRHNTAMSSYEQISWKYRLRCYKRGYYRIGPAHIESGDLFGFFSNSMDTEGRDTLLVYPKSVPLRELGIPSLRPLGDARGGWRIFEDLSRPSYVREYQRGDPLRSVDWKLTARTRQLQVRTYDPSSTTTVMLVVALESTRRLWEGYSPVLLERAITAAAAVATHAVESRYSLGMFSNGSPIIAERPMRIAPSQSPEQLTLVLEALASIPPLVMTFMHSQLGEHARKFPMGSTVVLVAAFIFPELVEVIADLHASGRPCVVLYVGDEACPDLPEGVTVYQLAEYFHRMELAGEFGPR